MIPASCYRSRTLVESIGKFKKVENFIRNRNDVSSTIWYKELLDELERRGVAGHKKRRMGTVDEIDKFFQSYVFDLVDSMSQSGYCLEKGADIGTVLINRDGKLDKAGSGDHRFYVARVLGLQRFPVCVVGVHHDWWRAKGKLCCIQLG